MKHTHLAKQVPSLRRSPTITPQPPISGNRIHRSPSACACGGGCPRCASTSAAAQILRKAPLGSPDDVHEREAEQTADRFMRMAGSVPPRPSPSAAGPSTRPAANPASSGGAPLPTALRDEVESRFGHDFSHVRVHTNDDAARAASSVQARAYTLGNDIVFGAGEYAPATARGQRLLAHELAHVVQQHTTAPSVVRRSPRAPLNDAPVAQATPLTGLVPTANAQLGPKFTVRTLSTAEFEAMSGIRASTLPDKQVLTPQQAGLGDNTLGSAGNGLLFAPRPTLPLPLGTTGVLWSMDAHLSQFAVVPQENPLLSFFFGNSRMSSQGFRSWRALHIGAAAERGLLGPAGGPATAALNRGAPGSYVSDLIDPYRGSPAVHGQGGPQNLAAAQALDACMTQTRRGGQLDSTYRFSTPPRNSSAYDRAFGTGAANNPAFEPPEVVNCLNKADPLTRQALNGRDLVFPEPTTGRMINVGSATYADTGEPVPGMLAGAARTMRESYLPQWDSNPNAQGMSRTGITPGMALNGVTGILRVGGLVLMIWNLSRASDRYANASAEDKPLVFGEELTGLSAGVLGGLIGEIIGEVVVCVGTGPAFALCTLAAGAAGGMAGGALAEGPGHALGQALKDAAELNRQGKLAPAIHQAVVESAGSPVDKQLWQDMTKIEKPKQPGTGLFDLFDF